MMCLLIGSRSVLSAAVTNYSRSSCFTKRLGTIVKKWRGKVYIQPDSMEDERVRVPSLAVRHLGELQQGDTVLYYCQSKRRPVATQIDLRTPASLSSPSEWKQGTVMYKSHKYVFIHPDEGEPNVFCLPSAFPEYGSAQVDDRVYYRAGPSEKDSSKHLQAIMVVIWSPMDPAAGWAAAEGDELDADDSDEDAELESMNNETAGAAASSRELGGVQSMVSRKRSASSEAPWVKSRRMVSEVIPPGESGMSEPDCGYGSGHGPLEVKLEKTATIG